jgi:hypothetical protein
MKIFTGDFKEHFKIANAPHWTCPACNQGAIVLELDVISEYETASSKAAWENTGDVDYLTLYFVGRPECSNAKCKEVIIITGLIKIHYEYNDDGETETVRTYYPKYAYPTLCLFPISDETPIVIDEAILKAFSLFWLDKAACANAIRTTVEIILDQKKVKKYIINKKGKRQILALHQRIKLFELKNKYVADHLMAIKWIGNTGSHISKIRNADVLIAFDILKHSLEKLYSTQEKQIGSITKKILKKKGPV